MTDPSARLARLRRKLAITDDPDDRADLAAAIDALEQSLASSAPRSHTQHITGYATIAAAIAGDVHGDLYIVGEHAQSARQLLAAYLRWLASQCGQLPLRGVREQKTATDVLDIGLDQVYTQLATNNQMLREVLEHEALIQFDAKAYLQQHAGAWVLPQQQRDAVRIPEPYRKVPDVEIAGFRNVYVPLEDATATADATFSLLESTLDIAHPGKLEALARDHACLHFFGPQLVTEAIATNPRLVLLGEPGSGKSTALRYLALTLARAGLDESIDLASRLEGWQTLGTHGELIPLFMPLLPLAKRLAGQPGRNGTAADLWSAIDAHLIDRGATPDVVAAIHAELTLGHVLLLLDGLDEVAGGDSRRQVVAAVQAFAAEQPQCRIIVACRVRAYEGEHNAAWQLPGWPTATLADWTRGQVRAFITAWYAAAAAASHMPDTKCDERVAALQRAVAEREDLRRLSNRPLLLTIMALVHLNDGTLPEDRVSLYARCIDILLGQWEIAGKDATVYGTLMHYIGLPDTDVKSLRPLLARAAYAAHDAAVPGEVGRLRRADLRETVADALEQLKHPNPHEGAKRFLEYTDVRAGLLQATAAGDAYAFPHQTFQEYLAGLELISGVDFVDRIMARRGDDRWRALIFMGVGHTVSEGVLSAPYQLLSRLLHAKGRDGAQRQHDLVFAAEIAEDVGWERLERGGAEFSALRADLARALAGVVEGSALPAAERVRAGMLLGHIGDPRPGVCDLPPAMVRIEGGNFLIGSTPEEAEQAWSAYQQAGSPERNTREWIDSEINDHPIAIVTFEIARYPVTNVQYTLFIDDHGYRPDQPWWDIAGRAWLDDERRWQPSHWDDQRFGQTRPNHPIVGASWYEAMAFCRWLTWKLGDGFIYQLPSEAEWEYAARGVARRLYPWGEQEPDGERVSFDRIYKGTTALGCFPAGATPEGVYDLAGGMWEWTRSIYAPGGGAIPNDTRNDLLPHTQETLDTTSRL
jgi:formylglycine-generating enzyme required for sulfatase activity